MLWYKLVCGWLSIHIISARSCIIAASSPFPISKHKHCHQNYRVVRSFRSRVFIVYFSRWVALFLVQGDNKTQEPHNYRPLACFAKYSFKLLTYRRRDAGSTNLPLRLASLCIDRSRCHSVLGSLIEHDYWSLLYREDCGAKQGGEEAAIDARVLNNVCCWLSNQKWQFILKPNRTGSQKVCPQNASEREDIFLPH